MVPNKRAKPLFCVSLSPPAFVRENAKIWGGSNDAVQLGRKCPHAADIHKLPARSPESAIKREKETAGGSSLGVCPASLKGSWMVTQGVCGHHQHEISFTFSASVWDKSGDSQERVPW